jgi:hypothetical protein
MYKSLPVYSNTISAALNRHIPDDQVDEERSKLEQEFVDTIVTEMQWREIRRVAAENPIVADLVKQILTYTALAKKG